MRVLSLISAGAALCAAISYPAGAIAGDVVIHAGRLIDGVSPLPRTNVSIVIHDDRIKEVTSGFVTPAGAQIIDLSKATVLPGLIDTHVHLMSGPRGNVVIGQVTFTPYDDLLFGVTNARKTLLAGFTSVRDLGDYTPAIVALKKATASGEIEGPRMWVAGGMLGPTGGHSDLRTGLASTISDPAWTEGIIDGPDQAIKKVRQRHAEGADLIKIAPSGGVTSEGDDPNAQLMTDAEIKAVVETAHTLHMKVAAHVHGREAIEHASALGVDSIEHGTFADNDSYKVMKAHDTYLVPTLIAGDFIMHVAQNFPQMLKPSSVPKALAVAPVMSRNAGNAYRAGIHMAFGTDAGVYPHGENAREFELLVKAGIPAMYAIQMATKNAADLIGDGQDIGSIQTGRYADIIATGGDPLTDITELQRVRFVMKSGTVVKAYDQNAPVVR
jgi:imidazolonepropionase-like amidohydrolase